MKHEIIFAALCSFILDLLFADPEWLLHPVVIMGRCITALEKILRNIFPKSKRGELAGGALLAVLIPFGVLAVTGGILALADRISHGLFLAVTVFWGWQSLALCGLRKESFNVFQKLKHGTLSEAQTAVARIVGRDTERLDEEGVAKAAIETVAENFSDGVVAPLLYFFLGGASLALCYKAINTMDSMLGYKNEKYLFFGRAAARLDDAANFIPSRIAALLLIAASFLCGAHGKNAWYIWRRDRRKHASPNSAQTESVMAGALGLLLAGPAWYFGTYYSKQTIGDEWKKAEPEDILRANRLLYCGGVLCLVLFGIARLGMDCLAGAGI